MKRFLNRVCVMAALAVAPAAMMAQEAAEQGTGAMLRALDKIDATTSDLQLDNGAQGHFGKLEVHLKECRYPEGNPSGDAFAYLRIYEGGKSLFDGWMFASSPALNALDHFRYDIWVMRCTLPETVQDPAQQDVEAPAGGEGDPEQAPVD